MNNKDEKFLILIKFKEFSINVEDVIERIPKKDFVSRNEFNSLIIQTIKLINMANYTKNIETKHKYQIEILANINTIDFIIERAYKLKYITEDMATKRCKELRSINAMVYKWCKNEEVSK